MDGTNDRSRTGAAWLTAGLLALAVLWDASGLDLPLARLAGSPAGFPWRDHWLLAAVLHDAARRLAWLGALALCLAVWWPPGPLARIAPADRFQLAASTLLVVAAVSLLKAGSTSSCPWDLAEFGGIGRYASHWSLQPDGGPGRCFPAGHASAGFGFVTGYFAFRGSQPRVARAWLAAALAAGLALGLAQQWRGAHFMSHTLWTAVACWLAAYGLDLGWRRARAARS